MCGFLQIISKLNLDYERPTLDSLRHRGPDEFREELRKIDDLEVATYHWRLSINGMMDPHMSQPLLFNGGNIFTYNGEFYEFSEQQYPNEYFYLQDILESETPIKKLYESDAMFAFSFLQVNEKKLFFGVDTHRVKPLFYYSDKEFIVISSDLGLLVRSFPQKSFNVHTESAYAFLKYGYVPQPNTIYEKIYSVKAGQVLEFDLENFAIQNSEISKHYSLLANKMPIDNEIVNKAIQRRLVSDTPVAIFLSGGVDSTLVATTAAQYSRQFQAYTAYNSTDMSEYDIASENSKLLSISLTPVKVEKDQMIATFEEMYDTISVPIGDIGILPSYAVSNAAKQDGFKVVLGGDGGDEYLYGYKRYRYAYILNIVRYLPRFFTGIVCKFLENRKKGISNHKFILALKNIDQNDILYEAFSMQFREDMLKKLLLSKVQGDLKLLRPKTKTASITQYVRDADILNYLPSILEKSDTASMAHSIELREPLLSKLITKRLIGYPAPRFGSIKKLSYRKLIFKLNNKVRLAGRKKGFVVEYKEMIDLLQHKYFSDAYIQAAQNVNLDLSKIRKFQTQLSTHEKWLLISLIRWSKVYS